MIFLQKTIAKVKLKTKASIIDNVHLKLVDMKFQKSSQS